MLFNSSIMCYAKNTVFENILLINLNKDKKVGGKKKKF